MEYNALNDALEQKDNTRDDEESYQLPMEVVRKHVVVEEVDPLLQTDDYRVEYHTHRAVVEQKKDKSDRHSVVPCHLLSVQFCTENRLNLVAVVHQHQHMHLEGVSRYRNEGSAGNQYTCSACSIIVRSIMSSCRRRRRCCTS